MIRPGYEAVETNDNPASDNAPAAETETVFWPKNVATFLEGARSDVALVKRAVPPDGEPTEDDHLMTLNFNVHQESCRFISYAFFWFMCGFAIAMTKFVTGPELANGPLVPGDTCPPFNGNKSHGFDINTDSHLKDAFGFNNVGTMHYCLPCTKS
jgi:hypothetical protein